MMPSTLGYWNIRGVAEVVRLMLRYVGEEYEEKVYNIEGPPTYTNDWFDKKFDLGLEMANEALKGQYLQMRLPIVLNTLEHFIGDRDVVLGKKINYSDFRVYESLAQHMVLSPECLKDFQKLGAYVTRFEKLPAIKAYLESKDFYKEPICTFFATWSNHPRK